MDVATMVPINNLIMVKVMEEQPEINAILLIWCVRLFAGGRG